MEILSTLLERDPAVMVRLSASAKRSDAPAFSIRLTSTVKPGKVKSAGGRARILVISDAFSGSSQQVRTKSRIVAAKGTRGFRGSGTTTTLPTGNPSGATAEVHWAFSDVAMYLHNVSI